MAGAIALVIAGCSTGANSTSSPGNPATASPAAFVPSVPPIATIQPTVVPEPTTEPERTYGPCPTATVLTPFTFVESDSACFAGKSIEIRGWMEGPPSMGFEGPIIEPSWLYYPTDFASAIWDADPVDPDLGCMVDGHDCAWFFLHVDPATGPTFATRSRWVIVTGHTHDPAAELCKYEDDLAPNPEFVDVCRAHFVLETIVDAP